MPKPEPRKLSICASTSAKTPPIRTATCTGWWSIPPWRRTSCGKPAPLPNRSASTTSAQSSRRRPWPWRIRRRIGSIPAPFCGIGNWPTCSSMVPPMPRWKSPPKSRRTAAPGASWWEGNWRQRFLPLRSATRKRRAFRIWRTIPPMRWTCPPSALGNCSRSSCGSSAKTPPATSSARNCNWLACWTTSTRLATTTRTKPRSGRSTPTAKSPRPCGRRPPRT